MPKKKKGKKKTSRKKFNIPIKLTFGDKFGAAYDLNKMLSEEHKDSSKVW